MATSTMYAAENISVGYFNKKPVIFTSKDGKVQGIAVDILKDIALEKNWTLTYIRGSLSECIERLYEGKVDLIVPIGFTESRNSKIDYTSEVLLQSWGCLFKKRGGSIQSMQDVRGKSIGYVKRSLFFKEFHKLIKDLGISCKFIEVSDYSELMKKIESGNVDGAIGDRFFTIGLEQGLKKKIEKLLVFYPFAMSFAVRNGDPKNILPAINSYLANGNIDPESRYVFHKNHWLSGMPEKTSPISLALLILFGVIVFIFIIYFVSRIPAVRAYIGLTEIVEVKMKINIFIVTVLLSIFLWLADSLDEYLIFEVNTDISSILLPLHDPHEMFMRIISIAVVLLSGIVISRVVARLAIEHKKTLENEENIRITLNSIGDAVIATDINSKIVRINPVASTMTGWSLDEALGKPLDEVFNIIHAVTRETSQNMVEKVLLRGEIVGLANHTKLISRDGSEYYISDSGAPISDSEGNIAGVVIVFHDDTEKYMIQEELKENERFLNSVIESVQDGISIINPDLTVRYVNNVMENWYSDKIPSEIRKCFECFDDSENNCTPSLTSLCFESGEMQKEVIHGKTGMDAEWLELYCYPIINEETGEVTGVAEFVRDITERRRAEEALRESENRYRNLFEQSADAVLIIKGNKFVDCNPATTTMLGYKGKTELLTCHPSKLSPEFQPDGQNSFDKANEMMSIAFQQGSHRFEWDHKRQNGEVFPVEVLLTAISVKDGDYLHVVWRDITERKRTEKTLLESEETFRSIIESSPMGMHLYKLEDDNRLVFIGANKAADKILGIDNSKFIGMDIEEAFPALIGTDTPDRYRKAAFEGVNWYSEQLVYEQGGISGAFEVFAFRMAPMKTAVFFMDITERKKNEVELQNLRNYISNIIDSMPSVLIGVNVDGRVTQWNREAHRITGIDSQSAVDRAFDEVCPCGAINNEHVFEAMRTSQTINLARQQCVEDGEIHYKEITIYPLIDKDIEGAVIRIDDVTEQVRIQELVVQSEKMMSVGGLAAGMAHEINNPLAGMIQTACVLKDRLTNLDLLPNQIAATEVGTSMNSISSFMNLREIPEMLDRINDSGRRVAEIVTNMLSLARKTDVNFMTYDLAELVDEAVDLSTNDFNVKRQYDFRKFEIIREYEKNLPHIPCEASKIQQVLLNILRNAAEAIQTGMKQGIVEKSSIIIRVALEKNKDMIRLEIEDSGSGMNESIRKRVFEPFFTTKPTDQGTGLGLSVSYFIITENHGGTMIVESEPGKGTKFIIHLPLADV